MSRSRVAFSCGDLVLEGVLAVPEGQAQSPAVVVCHPHPLYGGDMHNPVVGAVCQRLEEKGIASLRFNFRGTGASTGSHAQGVGEQDDLRAAVAFLEDLRGIKKDRIGVAGYSFGAGVATRVAASEDRLVALAAISLPPRMADTTSLLTCTKPKLFIAGSRDDFVPVEELERLVEALPEPKRCLIVNGEDHFWAYRLDEMAREVADFFSATV